LGKRIKHTLSFMRIMLTARKTSWVGEMPPTTLSVRFKVSIATFSAEIALSRPLGRGDLASMQWSEFGVVARKRFDVRAVGK
jgi:hypothetical protein